MAIDGQYYFILPDPQIKSLLPEQLPESTFLTWSVDITKGDIYRPQIVVAVLEIQQADDEEEGDDEDEREIIATLGLIAPASA